MSSPISRPLFDAVLFDCDGVLVDSEPITNGVLREMLGELGWQLSVEECLRLFVGRALDDQLGFIEANIGGPLPADFISDFRVRRNVALDARLVAVPGAAEAVAALHEIYASRIAVASGADRGKVELQLGKVGILPFFDGRIFSGMETARSKPAPDVYLQAAAALGVEAERCVVIEDTVSGATAGLAAGATVFGYVPDEQGHSPAEELLDLGVHRIFTSMSELPGLVTR